jgi:hypothetical protein
MAITGLIGGTIGATRGLLDPGITEIHSEDGRVIAKRRNQYAAALKNGLIGSSAAALGNALPTEQLHA